MLALFQTSNESTDRVCRPLDTLAVCETASQIGPAAPTRYAIRQALDQEYQKFLIKRNNEARQARYNVGHALGEEGKGDFDGAEQEYRRAEENAGKEKPEAPKRDFFGRIVDGALRPALSDGKELDGQSHQRTSKSEAEAGDRMVWVSFHEGFSNAVRKPIPLDELLRSF